MGDSRIQPMSDKDHIRVLQEEADSYCRFWIEERLRAVSFRARLARARKALEEMLVDPPATLDEPDSDAEVIEKMRAIARAALKEIS